MPISLHVIYSNGVCGPRAGPFVRFLAPGGAKFTKMGDSLWPCLDADEPPCKIWRCLLYPLTQTVKIDMSTRCLSACVELWIKMVGKPAWRWITELQCFYFGNTELKSVITQTRHVPTSPFSSPSPWANTSAGSAPSFPTSIGYGLPGICASLSVMLT